MGELMDQAGAALEIGDWGVLTAVLRRATGEDSQQMPLDMVETSERNARLARQTFAVQHFLTRYGSPFLLAIQNRGLQPPLNVVDAHKKALQLYLPVTLVFAPSRLFMRYQTPAATACLINGILDIVLACTFSLMKTSNGQNAPVILNNTCQLVVVAYLLLAQKPEACDLIDNSIRFGSTVPGKPDGTSTDSSKATMIAKLLVHAPENVQAIAGGILRAFIQILTPDSSTSEAIEGKSAQKRLNDTFSKEQRRNVKIHTTAVCYRCGKFRSPPLGDTTHTMRPYPACSRCRKASFCSVECQRAGMSSRYRFVSMLIRS